MEPIWECIKNCRVSLFRFEGLQDYSAEDGQDQVDLFIAKGVLAYHPDDTNEWWREMRRRNEHGISTARARLVTEPKTNYTQMELEYLKEARIYSGDDIRIITEEKMKAISMEQIPDFWIIDDKLVFLMKYGEKGKYLGSEQAENIQTYLTLKNTLLAQSAAL